MMGVYSYAVSRFVPDQIRNEPVNVGVVVVDPDTGKTAHKFLGDLQRLGPRCPGADLRSLKAVVDSIKFSDMPGGAKDLEQLATDHAYSLQFTHPRAVAAPTIEDALRRAFGVYVGDAEAAQPRPARSKSPKALVLKTIDAELHRHRIPPDLMSVRPEFPGSRGRFVPDRGLRTEGMVLALHAISFASGPAIALRSAKVLAVDFGDAKANTDGLECTAVVDPARNDDMRGLAMCEEASGHLQDVGCNVVSAAKTRLYVGRIARRLGPLGRTGRLPAH